MTADLTPAERAHVDRIEQAPDALGLREEVTEVLARHVAHYHGGSGHAACDCGEWEFWGNLPDFMRAIQRHQTDALLPLIERREAEAAKGALRDAADEMGEGDGISRFIGMDDISAAVRAEKRAQKWLRDRADWIGGTR